MWKKACVLAISLITAVSVFSVGYAYFNQEMSAAPSPTHPYYNVGENFERSNSKTITFAGQTWQLVYANQATGKGYLMSMTNGVTNYGCSGTINQSSGGLESNPQVVTACMTHITNSYQYGSPDKTAEHLNEMSGNNLNQVVFPDLSIYRTIVNGNEYGGFYKLYGSEDFYFTDIVNGGQQILGYWSGARTDCVRANGLQNVVHAPCVTNNFASQYVGYMSKIFQVMPIDLPQKGIIKSVTSDISNLVKPYNDSINEKDKKIGNIDTSEGEGPYRFIIYDTDASGNGNDQTPSKYFKLNPDSALGKAEVELLDRLPVGNYYFKVKVVDESQNERLYYNPGDPTDDPYRIKETKVMHVQITKVKPTIAFDDTNTTKKTVATAATPWTETATANPLNQDLKIEYTIVGGDIGLIDFDKDTAKVTYKGNGAFGKVKIRATVDDADPNEDNYDSAYTEKEIIIAQEVDGVITPDQASSDTKIPTFKTSDTNVKIGGTIGTIQGVKGTPDQITSGKTTYHYQIKNNPNDSSSYFQVNSTTGKITTNANLPKGEYEFVITVSDKWTSKDVSVKVVVGMAAAEDLKFYENKTSNTVIVKKEVEFTDTNVSVYATVKGSQNTNMVTYKLKDGEPTTVIEVHPTSGAITIVGTGTVTIVAEKEGASGQAKASTELEFTVKASEQKFKYTDNTLVNELPKTNGYYNAYKETYEKDKTFYVYTAGYPSGSTVTYQLSADSPQDVISVDLDGKIHILNASYKNQLGKVKVEATSHDPSGNYTDKTIVLPIDIEQAERKVEFKENPINVLGTKKGSVTPDILVDGTLDTETDPAKQAIIEVDAGQGSVAWTNDGKTIQYNWEDKKGKDINLTVTKPADRNYKVATGHGKLHILGADENPLTLSTPGKVTYGDHFIIRSTQNDGGSTNVQYKFETDNGVYISAPDVKGNLAEFDALAYSGSTFINIKVTRTADGELPSTKVVKIQVLPKPIEIEIDDKEKKRLEENPELTYQDFTSELVEWNGVRDVINTDVIKLTTTAKKTSPEGTYPIKAGNALQQLNKNYPNYTFTIKEGKLNIKDNGNKDFWDVDDDGCPDLNIILTDDNGDTILINGDKDEDGIPDINIDNKGDFKPHINIAKDGKTPTVNLVDINVWKPEKDYKKGNFLYDTMVIEPLLNIDTDGDGLPDINLDLDGDGTADINIDIDGDYIPDVDIDTTGDGKPDINIDNDGDGEPDDNIVEITEWKPGHNVDGPFPYDTMSFDDPENPDDADINDKPDGEVQGSYYPGDNVGGALTGDTTNIMLYIGVDCLSIGLILLILYKQKQDRSN